MHPRDHGNLNIKRYRVSTQQASATLSTLLEDKADMMPHKSRTLPDGTRVVEMVLPRGTKWKKFLLTINKVSRDDFDITLPLYSMWFHCNDFNLYIPKSESLMCACGAILGE